MLGLDIEINYFVLSRIYCYGNYHFFIDQYNELCYGGIALPFDLGLIFSNIEKESESVPTPDYEDSSCFKYLSTGK